MLKIRCVVERITFQNPENGYSILKTKVKGYDDLVTVVGSLSLLSIILNIQIWTMHNLYLQNHDKKYILTIRRSL